MLDTIAFAPGASSSSFLGHRAAAPRAVCVRPAGPRMMAEGGGNWFSGFKNPFAPSKATNFVAPQPGDPGYKEPEVEKSEPSTTAAAPQKSVKLPVKTGVTAVDSAVRGLSLLREDLFKSAPEAAGVGRQDKSVYIKPQYGDPGYKPQAYEVTYVSELGISPFQDDANAVDKVGGLEAVKEAAKAAKAGKAAKEIKREVLNIKKEDKPDVFDIPDYLKPIPEDTPRRGMTWKNYSGR